MGLVMLGWKSPSSLGIEKLLSLRRVGGSCCAGDEGVLSRGLFFLGLSVVGPSMSFRFKALRRVFSDMF